MFTPEAPIPPAAPMPHRKQIRQWLLPLSTRVVAWPLFLLAADWLLLLAAFSGAVLFDAWWLKLASGLAAGFMTGRLFVIGHDACHQSLTPHRRLNQWLGRIAFLPSLTPYSLWEVGHNVVHHGYTNLKGFDFVWAPLTAAEYAALSPRERMMERIYRSGWAPGLYYMVEIWWKKMFFPSRRQMPTRRRIFVLDNLLVTAFALLWIGGMAAAA
ncbi:MAG: fatty acid desaturase, partial [Comamonadaceae bacterium]